jgi:N-acetylglutamate synthase-like GNAT family acetyltransferase
MIEKAIIKEYTKENKQKVIDLFRLNTPDYFSPEEEKDLVYYLDNEIEKYYVLHLDGEIAGCGGINFKENKTVGCISWDFLHPQVHGKGLGTLLLEHRINILKEDKNIKTIIVRTSQLAYKFYEKAGFELIEKTKDYWAKGFDLYKMEYINLPKQ